MRSVVSSPAVVAPAHHVEVGVLGAVGTRIEGALEPIPGGRVRALLVALALRPGRAVSVSTLVEDVWPDGPPRAPKNALQTQISRLRAVLPAGMVESGPAGYRLAAGPGQVDLARAERLVADARDDTERGDHAAAATAVEAARRLWRGEPAADLPDSPLADELRRRARAVAADLDTLAMDVAVACGDNETALPLLDRAREQDPANEQVAANLMRCLHALGRTNEALAVFAELRATLADRLGADPSRALVDLNAELLVPQASRKPATVGLRASPNPLIGRTVDIDAIEATMATARVTTILGPGGSGKTRIAHELGLRASSTMPVAFVELASLRRGEDVASAITNTLGLSEADLKIGGMGIARVHTAQERLRDALGQAPSLLVLDNCEHLVDDVARIVDELVSASAFLTVLITSRSPLSITAEATYPLPPLEIGGRDSAAVELFVARARAVRPGATLDVADVERLCRTLDGLPLAIELAAARVRTLTVADIGARLEHRFALLRSTDRTRPERHRTLHAVIDWSWTLLEPQHRDALTRLCRFPAGFTASAAERVAGAYDVAEALDGLVRQSLLTVVDEGDHVRYHMLETVREFGEEQLSKPTADVVAERMMDWGTAVAEAAWADYTAGRQLEAIRALEADHDNIVDVLRQSLHLRRWRQMYAMFSVVSYFWSVRGAHTEVSHWAPRILEAPAEGSEVDDVEDDHLVLAQLVVLAHVGYNADMRSTARVRMRLRRALTIRTSVEPGLRFVAEVLVGPVDGRGLPRTLARGVRSEHDSVRNAAYMIRASLHENFGYLREAERDVESARAVAARRGDRWSVASAAQSMGSIRGQSGRFEEAIESYTEASDLLWELHSYDESMQMRGFVGAALIAAGRIGEGRALMTTLTEATSGPESTLPIDAEDADQRLASITAALGEADIADGDTESGLTLFRRSVEISGFSHERQGDPYLTMLASASVSAHALHGGAGRIDDAVALLESVAATRLGTKGFRDLPQLGSVACAVGSYDVHSGRDQDRGLRLLALSVRARARMDYPSMDPGRHLEAARVVLGAEVVDRAVSETANTTRAEALEAILELLRP